MEGWVEIVGEIKYALFIAPEEREGGYRTPVVLFRPRLSVRQMSVDL